MHLHVDDGELVPAWQPGACGEQPLYEMVYKLLSGIQQRLNKTIASDCGCNDTPQCILQSRVYKILCHYTNM